MRFPLPLGDRRGGATLLSLFLFGLLNPALASIVPITNFSQFPQGWEARSFKGETDYTTVVHRGRQALEAYSESAASGLVRHHRVDLRSTPYLNWSWSVANRLEVADERSKRGDDFSARVYVIFSTGPFFWQTRTLNYVWSNNQVQGTVWPNPYTGKSTMMALRGPGDPIENGQTEKRNVYEDIRRLTGEEIDEIKAVAIMTDTDNSGQQARARYGRIYFSQQ